MIRKTSAHEDYWSNSISNKSSVKFFRRRLDSITTKHDSLNLNLASLPSILIPTLAKEKIIKRKNHGRESNEKVINIQ